jgi:hypothetical protein
MLTFLTYKRICDAAAEKPDDIIFHEDWRWTHFRYSTKAYHHLASVTRAINYENFETLTYGTCLIPDCPHFSNEDAPYIHKVLRA